MSRYRPSSYAPQVRFYWKPKRTPRELRENIDRFEGKTIKEISYMIYDAAELFINNIRENWSPVVPSAPYQRPAFRTGVLDGTIGRAPGYMRDRYGRFASPTTGRGTVTQVHIIIDTAFVDRKRGSYALPLEVGHINHRTGKPVAPRPFLEPAMEVVRRQFPELVERTKKRFGTSLYLPGV